MSPRKKNATTKNPDDREVDFHPATPDQMSAEVIEFITAIDDYKRKRGRPFPSWSEVLEIVKSLGYERLSH